VFSKNKKKRKIITFGEIRLIKGFGDGERGRELCKVLL
jgi:hypothetical protein